MSLSHISTLKTSNSRVVVEAGKGVSYFIQIVQVDFESDASLSFQKFNIGIYGAYEENTHNFKTFLIILGGMISLILIFEVAMSAKTYWEKVDGTALDPLIGPFKSDDSFSNLEDRYIKL
mmetsp:Transcript_14871/g.16575  ORF Transcript_14871/g.16575 Transcript_14871/m.16575 type:complete len:120 (+) Transcript_14871:1-360(+)